MSVPTTTKAWSVKTKGFKHFDGLTFEEKVDIPKLGDKEVLVKIQGASLNYRDLIIPMGKYSFPLADTVVPGSDGSGTVVAVGSKVTLFKEGDEVLTLFNQGHIGGSLDQYSLQTGLGGVLDGTLRQYGAFDELGLVHKPKNLNHVEAATLSCAGLTAWNALYGLKSNMLKAGDYVLTQGTGGVSIFAIQFAKAAGAIVIATTSSAEKTETLKKLGADHVINYKETPEWGAAARKLTPEGRGVNHVVEVAGPTSMKQSLGCIAVDGVISIIGFVGGFGKDQPGFLDCLLNICIARGILVGSRTQLIDMCRAIEANDSLKPVVDQKVFSLEETKEAYQYMWDQKHFGKVCIKIE